MDLCSISSGTNSAISISASCQITITNSTINSSNTNAITGAGTVNYGGLIFTSSSKINTTTQTPIPLTFGTSTFVVGKNTGQGQFRTISAAVAAASAGDTVYVSDGTYTENVILKSQVNIVSLSATAGGRYDNRNVIIQGKVYDNGTGVSVSLFGIAIYTNGDYAVESTGAGSIVLNSCYISAVDHIPFHLNNGSANFVLSNCTVDLSNNFAFYTINTGDLWVTGSYVVGSSSNTSVPATAAGPVFIFNSSIDVPLSATSTGSLDIKNSTLNTSQQNTAAVTTAGTGTSTVQNCVINSGTASALSVGAGTTVYATSNSINSSNTNAITGAGTVNYSNCSFLQSKGANATTQTSLAPQISFVAIKTANSTNVTGNGTVYTIVFDNATNNSVSAYNAATGVFTAPTTGLYHFTTSYRLSNIPGGLTSASTNAGYFSSSGGSFYFSQQNVTGNRGSDNRLMVNGSAIIPMTKGNTCSVQIVLTGGTQTVGVDGQGGGVDLTFFSGHLIA